MTTHEYFEAISTHFLTLIYRGRSVTALGVLFDFTGNAKGTTVQKVEDMVKENWVGRLIWAIDIDSMLIRSAPSSLTQSRRNLISSSSLGK